MHKDHSLSLEEVAAVWIRYHIWARRATTIDPVRALRAE
jgi:hypothetical protein